MNYNQIVYQARLELARRDFWEFCKLTAPDFYAEDRLYLKDLCRQLQHFVESDEKVIVINMPPRHGKSRTATLLVEWIFGINPKLKVMTGSYNETLSTTFAKQVRDTIWEEKTEGILSYCDIFPNTKIKYGESSAAKWALQGSSQTSYLATSPKGTATGFGCFAGDTMVITDKGEMKIEDIFNDKTCNRTLSFDTKNGKIRYNKIIAKRKLVSNEIFKVQTAEGKEIICTADHRFFTKEKGWVRADSLGIGNTLVTASYNNDLREMRENLYQKKVRGEQSIKKWFQTHLLFKTMCVCGNQRKSFTGKVRSMWKAYKRKAQILFGRMQKQKFTKGFIANRVSYLWERVQTTLTQNGLLFNGLQKQSPFRTNERRGKFSLQNWYKLQSRVSENEAAYIRQGQASMSNMWSYRKTSTKQEIWYNNEFEGTSHRREYTKQYNGKFDNIVSRVPYKVTQDKVASIEPLATSSFVYDIQVENDENFFANGVLVHNCNIMIIDDLIKSSAEAFNENILLQHQDWFNNTMLSRTENGFKLIIIMTRWATNDLAGYILNQYQGVRHINYKALQDDGTMLCDSVLNAADFTFKTRAMAKEIISANYQQEPMDIKGRLYTQFKTYSQKPDFKYLLNYTDTADTGEDYLCSINYGVTFDGDYYILDVLYTKEPMEVTEPLTAKMLTKDNIGCALIESNNGGRGFARNVQRELKELGNTHTNIQWFHQSQNKQARIFSNSASVMAKVYYPENWLDRFPEFADSLLRYQKEGKNAHDDAPDALTGVYENNKPKGGWLY